MYTIQALWTQAREGLDVTTVVLANRSYAILKLELSRVGAEAAGPEAGGDARPVPPRARLRRPGRRHGRAGHPGHHRRGAGDQLEQSFATPGPHLVEAVVPGL